MLLNFVKLKIMPFCEVPIPFFGCFVVFCKLHITTKKLSSDALYCPIRVAKRIGKTAPSSLLRSHHPLLKQFTKIFSEWGYTLYDLSTKDIIPTENITIMSVIYKNMSPMQLSFLKIGLGLANIGGFVILNWESRRNVARHFSSL